MNRYGADLRQETANIQASVRRLTNYFLTQWINDVTPAVFSVFGLPNRTNNMVENWHRYFNQLCQGSHINLWDFIRKDPIL